MKDLRTIFDKDNQKVKVQIKYKNRSLTNDELDSIWNPTQIDFFYEKLDNSFIDKEFWNMDFKVSLEKLDKYFPLQEVNRQKFFMIKDFAQTIH